MAARHDQVRGKGVAQLVALADKQERIVDLKDLRTCGFSRMDVTRHVGSGWLSRLHSGVYLVGSAAPSLAGRFVAAVKACGDQAALGPRASLELWGYLEWDGGDVDVLLPSGMGRSREGISICRSSSITREDLMPRLGILVMKAVPAVVIGSAYLPRDELRRAARRALADRKASIPALLRALDRFGSTRGTRKLRTVLAEAVPTRSELEDVVYDLIVGAGFVPPQVNQPLRLDGRTVIPDFRWPEQRLVLEADSRRWHGDAISRADDAERQALLERHGESVVRVTWEQAVRGRSHVEARLARAGAPRARGPNGSSSHPS